MRYIISIILLFTNFYSGITTLECGESSTEFGVISRTGSNIKNTTKINILSGLIKTSNKGLINSNFTINVSLPLSLKKGGSTFSKGTRKLKFTDVSDFDQNLNGWIFLGQWGRYTKPYFDKKIIKRKKRATRNTFILMCNLSSFPSTLQKKFCGLKNASISITHLVQYKKDFQIKGIVKVRNKAQKFFILNETHTTVMNGIWMSHVLKLPDFLNKNVTILLQPTSKFGDAIWVIGRIEIENYVTNKKWHEMKKPNIFRNKLRLSKMKHNISIRNKLMTKMKNISKSLLSPIALQRNTTDNHSKNSTVKINYDILDANLSRNCREDLEEMVQKMKISVRGIWYGFYLIVALYSFSLIVIVILIVKVSFSMDSDGSPTISSYSKKENSNGQLGYVNSGYAVGSV